MNRRATLAAVCCAFALAAAPGCVERELFIRSEPTGAEVIVDGMPRGFAPLLMPFEFYGTREIELRLPGYEVYSELLEIGPPLYQVFPLDFFCEVLIPYTWTDSRAVEVLMRPIEPEELENEERVLERARELQRST